jgi:hypothetical protein
VPSVKACDVRCARLLRSDEHYVVPRIAARASHRREIFLQPLTVADCESLPRLLDWVACDLFCLFDFHFSCPPVSGGPRSLHRRPGERGRETGDRSGEIGASRSERAARLSGTAFCWRERCQWRPKPSASCAMRRDASISGRQQAKRTHLSEQLQETRMQIALEVLATGALKRRSQHRDDVSRSCYGGTRTTGTFVRLKRCLMSVLRRERTRIPLRQEDERAFGGSR